MCIWVSLAHEIHQFWDKNLDLKFEKSVCCYSWQTWLPKAPSPKPLDSWHLTSSISWFIYCCNNCGGCLDCGHTPPFFFSFFFLISEHTTNAKTSRAEQSGGSNVRNVEERICKVLLDFTPVNTWWVAAGRADVEHFKMGRKTLWNLLKRLTGASQTLSGSSERVCLLRAKKLLRLVAVWVISAMIWLFLVDSAGSRAAASANILLPDGAAVAVWRSTSFTGGEVWAGGLSFVVLWERCDLCDVRARVSSLCLWMWLNPDVKNGI